MSWCKNSRIQASFCYQKPVTAWPH